MSAGGRVWGVVNILGSLSLSLLSTACAKGDNPRISATEAASAPTPAPQALATPSTAAASPPPVASALPSLPPPDAKTRAQCANICGRSHDLHCKGESACLPNCLAMQAATPCGAAFSAFYACLVAEPTKHFECDVETGVAQIRVGYCETEQQLAFRCMEEKMKQ